MLPNGGSADPTTWKDEDVGDLVVDLGVSVGTYSNLSNDSKVSTPRMLWDKYPA